MRVHFPKLHSARAELTSLFVGFLWACTGLKHLNGSSQG